MGKGTIYKETYSKGIKNGHQVKCNRWCVEFTVNGTRYRKRFQHYCQAARYRQEQRDGLKRDVRKERILRMVESGTLQPIKGLEDYCVDARRRRVYSLKRNTRLTPHMICDSEYVNLRINRQPRIVSINRILMAIKYDIPLTSIPSYLCAVCENGNLTVKRMNEHLIESREKWRTNYRTHAINRLADEVSIIQRYYQTGNDSELIVYIETNREYMKLAYKRKYSVRVGLDDLIDAAVYNYLKRIKKPSSIITNITGNILLTMRTIRTNQIRTRQLNERFI